MGRWELTVDVIFKSVLFGTNKNTMIYIGIFLEHFYRISITFTVIFAVY